MAKAVFHKGQRVYVKPVGTWAQIEAVLPQWVKGVEEPLKVTYEVGLGREFQTHELVSQEEPEDQTELVETEKWRVMRRPNRWEQRADARQSQAGSYPVVVTDERDWGGWRVPVSEYERDPARIELQARVMANALKMLRVCRELTMLAADHALDTPAEIMALAAQAEGLLASIAQDADQPAIAAE
ncbi:MAG: hypothetical protein GC206_11495 [Alphaproteobacteria bacterium]|nr:hypothetical protein [Alphaproteobacteria bacterium]